MTTSGRASGGGGAYLSRQAANPARYVLEQLVLTLFGWIPTILGIAVRALVYRLILKMDASSIAHTYPFKCWKYP